MNIQEFRSSFEGELAKPSRFHVIINLPASLGSTIDSRTLALRCENAVIPGRTIATSDLRIYGPTEKYPYQSSYEDITLTFICDDSMIEKAAFDAWMEKINPQSSWNFEYKSNYASTITIIQFDNSNNEVHKVNLIDAFPIAVNQLDLDWSSDAPYHKLSVVFAYTYWETQATAQVKHAAGSAINSPFNLAAALQIGALAVSSGKALTNGNPYALASVAGAATSIIPSLGGTQTISSLINNSGRGAVDTSLDQGASKLNSDKLTIGGLTSTANKFIF
jgi:hypothetical protein